MSTNIYVGNLSPRTTENEVRNLFTPYGEVDSVNLITDRYSGDSRGVVRLNGFVDSRQAATRAVELARSVKGVNLLRTA